MNNSGYGIWLQGTNNCTVSNNKVTMSVKASVSGGGNSDCIRLVKSKNNVIEKNTLTQKKKNKKTASACGIVITTKSSATVTGNKIMNSPKDGIFVVAKSSAKITKNNIKKTGRHGVNVCEKSTVTMKGNKISGYKAKITNTYAGGKIKEK
jgi:parallel beta-helix repeat protein